MTKILKAKTFEWNDQTQAAFEEIKHKLTCASIVTFPSFTKVFEVECDASGAGIRAILSQEKSPLPSLVNNSMKPKEICPLTTKSFMLS